MIGALLLAAALLPQAAPTPATGIHREPLQTAEFPGHGLHTVVVRTTVDPGATIAAHSHAGIEIAYVAAGEVSVTLGTAAPMHLKSGQSWQVPPRLVHSLTNPGAAPAVIVSTYIVDPAAPLATPAH